MNINYKIHHKNIRPHRFRMKDVRFLSLKVH